jgi:hypothetical protein
VADGICWNLADGICGLFRLVLLPDVHEQTLCERSACTVALKRARPVKAVWLTASSMVVEALQHDACRSKVRKRVVADWRCNRRLLWEPCRKVYSTYAKRAVWYSGFD